VFDRLLRVDTGLDQNLSLSHRLPAADQEPPQ
jgi:hypothetical protein